MKIAVVGGGIAGLSAAWQLQQHGVDVDLYEADTRLGGHTRAHVLGGIDGQCAVDIGFSLFNDSQFPQFSRWLEALDVGWQETAMGFAVADRRYNVEYGCTTLGAVAAHPVQLARPGYWRLWRDFRRFWHSLTKTQAENTAAEVSLGRYLSGRGFSDEFIQMHVIPLCAALWSLPAAASLELPAGRVIGFMQQHLSRQGGGAAHWRAVQGGASSYLAAFRQRFKGKTFTDARAQISLRDDAVLVYSRRGVSRVDAVVLACHSDQALSALRNPSRGQVQTLLRLPFRQSEAYLHSDASFMPRRRVCWSGWNVIRERDGGCTTTYWMNRLQNLPGDQQYFVTLNPPREPGNCLWRGEYERPYFTREAERAKLERWEIATPRLSFAGAYWGDGFHEDGFVSGREAADYLLTRFAHTA